MTVAPSTPPTRVHGLDALRATALGLGIVLHSLMPFVPGLPWLVVDDRTTPAAGIGLFVIHLFRMVLFMVLAGYFGRMVLHRRGTGGYLKDRALRILLPLFAFWPLAVLPLALLAVLNAELRDVPLPEPPGGTPERAIPFDPGQLWFLAVLVQCVVVVVVVRALAVTVLGAERAGRWSAFAGAVLSAPGGVLLAAVPYLVCLQLQGGFSGGINQPTSLLPSPPALTAYLGAFVVGWFWHARGAAAVTDRIETPPDRPHAGTDGPVRLGRQWPVHLALAVVLSVAALVVETAQITLLVHHVLVALAGWTWVYGLVGLFARHLTRERAWVRYLADSSYWAYLLHLPLLVGIEIVLADLSWPIPVKLALTWVVTAVVLLVSYDLLVRSTWVGRWLNGRRHPRVLLTRRPAPGPGEVPETGEEPRQHTGVGRRS